MCFACTQVARNQIRFQSRIRPLSQEERVLQVNSSGPAVVCAVKDGKEEVRLRGEAEFVPCECPYT